MPRCPKCRCHFRVPEDEDSGHACPRCGYGDPDNEPCEGWDREDFRTAAADQQNDIEREEGL
jgi:hypothetical protein